jgi:hypothetical protein
VIGTSHLLSLDIPDESEGNCLSVSALYDRFTPFNDKIFGDFYVCARARRLRGQMESVHLTSMKNSPIVRH